MVITVVNIMLAGVTVLKNYSLSTKLHFVWYSYLCLSYGDRSLTSFSLFIDFATRLESLSHSNDFILYCLYLSNERFLENEGVFFFQKVRVNEFANLGLTFFLDYF